VEVATEALVPPTVTWKVQPFMEAGGWVRVSVAVPCPEMTEPAGRLTKPWPLFSFTVQV